MLAAQQPYCVSWRDVAVHVMHTTVRPSDVLHVLNGSIVALASLREVREGDGDGKGGGSDGVTNGGGGGESDGLPNPRKRSRTSGAAQELAGMCRSLLIQHETVSALEAYPGGGERVRRVVAGGEPLCDECFGLGIVRSIDPRKKKVRCWWCGGGGL